MSRYLAVLISVAFVTFVTVEAAKKTVCENESLDIKCGKNAVIEIQSSLYGRQSGAICANHPKAALPQGGCSASSALSVVRAKCDGKQTCSVGASNGVFGDPCGGTYKYMTVSWKCLGANVKTVCEHESVSIKCGKNKVIEIQGNLYGRQTGAICANHPRAALPQGGCGASSALSVAKATCDGKQTCSLAASNGVFGDPCVNTFKYMTTAWKCVNANVKTVCEHESVNIKCGKNKVIEIQGNLYGRQTEAICANHPRAALPQGGCGASSALSVAKATCDGKQTCSLAASNGVFGDPCVNTFKYMTTSWKCVNAKVKTVCEHESVNIKCSKNKVIEIQGNLYGRQTGAICANHPRAALPQGGCGASSALSVAKATCDGKQTCSLAASNGVFGDPCVNTFKYMTTAWNCVKPNALTACEGSDLHVSCPGNKVIKILSGFYGRQSTNICGQWGVPQGGCSASTALHVVQSLCDGKISCAIPANNNGFGDPCHGTHKYMTVSWTCK